jgi:hypothetical protein
MMRKKSYGPVGLAVGVFFIAGPVFAYVRDGGNFFALIFTCIPVPFGVWIVRTELRFRRLGVPPWGTNSGFREGS